MLDPSRLISQLRLAAVILALAGVGLIASTGARGPDALTGFGMFCLGMAALDGLYRGRFGFRQLAVFLGWLAVGMGAWVAVAKGFSQLLGLPLGGGLDALLIGSASCAAGSALSALLATGGPLLQWERGRRWFGAIGGLLRGAVARLGGRGRDRPLAEQRWRPAGPVQGG